MRDQILTSCKAKLTLLVALATCHAVLHAPVSYAENAMALRCDLSTPKTEMLLYEPLVLDCTVENVGGNPVTIQYPGQIGGALLMLYHKGHGDASWTRFRPASSGSTIPTFVEIEPNGEFSIRTIIVGEDAGNKDSPFLLDSPGAHDFYFQLVAIVNGKAMPDDGWPRVESNTLTITVNSPTGRHAQAAEVWRQAHLSQGGIWGAVLTEPVGALKLVTDYPDTSYGVYTRYLLTLNPASRAGLRVRNGVSERELVVQQLEFLLSQEIDNFPLLDEVALRRAVIYLQDRQEEDAIELLEPIVHRRTASSAYSDAALRLAEAYRRQGRTADAVATLEKLLSNSVYGREKAAAERFLSELREQISGSK